MSSDGGEPLRRLAGQSEAARSTAIDTAATKLSLLSAVSDRLAAAVESGDAERVRLACLEGGSDVTAPLNAR